MMKARGHTVFLYAGEQNEAPCDELITCISERERASVVGAKHYTEASFDPRAWHWRGFNGDAIAGIARRAKPHDFLCLIGGTAQKPIADAFPGHMSVEVGVGYGGWFSPYKVFESYAWMHMNYGARAPNGDPHAVDGAWFDAVIPGYLEPLDFPLSQTPEDYFLFMGRMTSRKGFGIAQQVCQHIGARLILAGPGGDPGGYGEYVGVVGPAERAKLMGGARALFAPTTYIEPFGNVAVEAQACGTPVIATDWGAFTETVVEGVTGYRCRSLKQFVRAAEVAPALDRSAIHRRAVETYSLPVIGERYEDYFLRLETLWGDGWNAL